MKKILLILLIFLASCWENIEVEKDDISQSKIILALGDSLTAWYSLDLSESYPEQLKSKLLQNWYNYDVINAWVSWDTSTQLLNRLDLYLDDEENLPQIAILVIWWNDWLRWWQLDTLKENIINIISELKNKNIKVILWWMKIPPNLWLNYSRDFFKLYEDIADNEDVYLIEFFLEGVAWDRKYNLNDWIHPNKQGYDIISGNVFEFLLDNKLIKSDWNK